jgi:hypothetical protein
MRLTGAISRTRRTDAREMARAMGLWTSMAAEPAGSSRRRRPLAHRGALGRAGQWSSGGSVPTTLASGST